MREMSVDKQRSSIHGFARRATAIARKRRAQVAARADSKQSNQSWLNELLIISRTRQSGEGNCPYNGGAKYARPTVCGERMAARGWRSDHSVGLGVLLDKYRENSATGESNENENKEALRNYDSPVPCAARRRNRDTFPSHAASRTLL